MEVPRVSPGSCERVFVSSRAQMGEWSLLPADWCGLLAVENELKADHGRVSQDAAYKAGRGYPPLLKATGTVSVCV